VSRELKKTETEKLQKVMARAGVASRRESERLISQGSVTVDGKIATIGDRVGPGVEIHVDGKPVHIVGGLETRVILYHKPEGEICTRDDPDGRRTVFESLPSLKIGRWIIVGRLDINTTGLLLFTNNGEVANTLMHPSSNLEREYQVRILGEITPAIIARLTKGVMLDDGMASFKKIEVMRGQGANKWCKVVLMEGRNREVKRLFESQGLQVNKLKRTRFGKQYLPKSLSPGHWIEGKCE